MNYPCIVFSQRTGTDSPKFCLFHAPVGDLMQWTTIPRLSPEEPNGIQRAKNDYKVRGIKKFLSEDSRNTIPTAIVLTMAKDSYSLADHLVNGINEIMVDPSKKEGIFVVDGQHRLYGLHAFDPSTKVPVVSILNASEEEKAFQFIVINNKVSKINLDHIRALTINFGSFDGQPGLDARLRSARLSLSRNVNFVGLANETADSPFKGIVALPDTPEDNRWIVPAAIESSIAYIQSKNLRQLENDDAAYELLITIWSTIKSNWQNAFHKESKLLSKVGFTCMTRYVIDVMDFMLSYLDDNLSLANAEDVKILTEKVLKLQSEAFWLSSWSISVSDTKSVRDAIDTALKSIQQNIRDKQEWNVDVSLVK